MTDSSNILAQLLVLHLLCGESDKAEILPPVERPVLREVDIHNLSQKIFALRQGHFCLAAKHSKGQWCKGQTAVEQADLPPLAKVVPNHGL